MTAVLSWARTAAALAALAFPCTTLHAQETHDECAELAVFDVASELISANSEPEPPANCKARFGYYAPEGVRDDAALRRCAFAERQSSSDDSPLSGSAILAMLYANGEGVPRHLPLARKFACEFGEQLVPGDLQVLLRNIDAIQKAPSSAEKFDVCSGPFPLGEKTLTDYPDGLSLERECRAFHWEVAELRNERALAQAQADWSADLRKQFADTLAPATKAFVVAASQFETDETVPYALVMVEYSYAKWMRQHYYGLVSEFESGQIPTASADDAVAAEAQLRALIKAIHTGVDAAGSPTALAGSLTPEGIDQVQTAWQLHRNAWETFATQQYPGIRKSAVTTHLIRLRLAMLRDLLRSTAP